MRRFAPASLPVYTGFLASRSTARLAAPRDAVTRNWQLVIKRIKRTAALDVCAM